MMEDFCWVMDWNVPLWMVMVQRPSRSRILAFLMESVLVSIFEFGVVYNENLSD